VQRSRDNHYLDCEAMQAGLAHWLRVDLLREASEDDQAPQPAASAAADDAAVAPKPPRRSRPRLRPDETTPPTAAADVQTQSDKRAARRARIAALAQRLYS
jgi:hypothetical protein